MNKLQGFTQQLEFTWYYPRIFGKLYPRWVSTFYFGFNKSFKPWFKLSKKQLFPNSYLYIQVIIFGIHYGEAIKKHIFKENK